MARNKPCDLGQRQLIPIALEAQIFPSSFERALIGLIDRACDLRCQRNGVRTSGRAHLFQPNSF